MQKLTNHIAFVVDKSASMSHLEKKIVEVFDSEIAHLRQRSIDLDQETRVSVYFFDDNATCSTFDVDVMRTKSLRGEYRIGGNTALMDATALAIKELGMIPELHSDHSFLVFVLTDGEENRSRQQTSQSLAKLINGLPDHWTVAVQVPNAGGVHEAKKFGFPAGNIQVWDTTSSKGLESAARSTRSAMDTYMTNRAQGTRGTRSFFTTDLGSVAVKDVVGKLEQLKPKEYELYNVRSGDKLDIRTFVEAYQKEYVIGSAYYQLSKAEDIQSRKAIAIQHRKNGKVYSGDAARQLLKLPDFEVRVKPGDHGDWRIFVQSTSVNRKLVSGTQLLVLK